MKIGIIGYGYVGKAVAAAYEESEVMINDPLHDANTSIADMKAECDVIFVCVPTPANGGGAQDARILTETIDSLQDFGGIVIAKSTALPQTYTMLESKYTNMKLVHVPEFLTAANAVMDYQCPVKIVVGCRPELRMDVIHAIITDKINYDVTTVSFCSIAEAAMVKYVANTMLAMKVVISNEYYDLCNALGVSWDNVVKVVETDQRLGNTHWRVPGTDGSRGFGGHCFPKDVSALLSLSKFLNTDSSMLEAAVAKNNKLRN